MELFAMGGYGAFVWSSYLLTLVVVVVSALQGRSRHRQVIADVRRKLEIEET